MNERIVITGMGALTPLGIGVDSFWENLIAGKCGIGEITMFDASPFSCRIGAEVKDFRAVDHLPAKLVRETDRFIHFALVAAQMALEDSGLDMQKEDPYSAGVIFGTSTGGITTVTEEQTRLVARPGSRVSPHFMPKILPNMAAAQVAIRHGLRGLCQTICTACASGSDVVAAGMGHLRMGHADVIIAGGCESMLCPLVFGGLCSARSMSTRNDDPARASRPFDLHRDGMVMGEGAGVVVMETLGHARRRNARVLAELVGCGSCGDGFHTVAPEPEGKGEAHCMRRALAVAGLNPEEVDYINAHGTSTPQGDRVETAAIKEVFGPGAYRIPVSSIKGATGHTVGAAGAIELITSVKVIREGLIPPTINLSDPDPQCDLDYVPNLPRRKPVSVVLSNSFGFGGQNASVIVRDYRE